MNNEHLFLLRNDYVSGDVNNRFLKKVFKDILYNYSEVYELELEGNAGFCNDEPTRIFWVIYVGY